MLVMRFLTNKQVFKAPSWYLTHTFWRKSFKKHGKIGGEKGNFFSIFFILLKSNTKYAHMQNFIQIPQKMKTEVQNVFKWENSTLPFWSNITMIIENSKRSEFTTNITYKR